MQRLKLAFWPTVFAVPAIVIMLGLAVWQVQRMTWKTALIDRLHSRMAEPAIDAAAVAADPAAAEYRKVRLVGTFLHDKEIHLLARSLNRNVGVHIVTPLRLESGEIVLFNRGWVPEQRKDPARRPEGQVSGTVTVEGVVRLTEADIKGWFIPDNQPDRNVWLTVDVAAMRRAVGVPDAPGLKADRWWVAADAAPNPGGFPIGGQTRVNLPNDHLQYAITWLLLACTLAAVYVAYHWRRQHPVAPPPPERG
ncbi:MAG TPA: SURF1 family protein [Vineibacter sp.]|nr:SURF1 family protein [Vineibacter sp.]